MGSGGSSLLAGSDYITDLALGILLPIMYNEKPTGHVWKYSDHVNGSRSFSDLSECPLCRY